MNVLLHSVLLVLATSSLLAATNAVRMVEAERNDVVSAGQSRNELAKSASEGFGGGKVTVSYSEVIAWCVKLDHLECPPRLFEEAIVMVKCAMPVGSNAWALAYLGRMPNGSALDRSWHVFGHAGPLTTFSSFAGQPSDGEISAFIKATNFGHNDFYPDRLILDVVLYRKSSTARITLSEGIPAVEKHARHAAHLKSIAY